MGIKYFTVLKSLVYLIHIAGFVNESATVYKILFKIKLVGKEVALQAYYFFCHMAKRFTDTDKWKKPFLRSLDAPYKLLWFYILDDCDHAGIWQSDFEVASIRIGFEVNEKKMMEIFGDRVQKFSAAKFFIPDFIFFQYGILNDKNRLHLSVINILNKYQIKPLASPLEGVKDKDKDKEQDKDKVKDKDKGGEGGMIIPELLQIWVETNPHYSKSKENDYPALMKILNFIMDNSGAKDFTNTDTRIKILNTFQAIADFVKQDDFWCDKPLLSISKNIQEFYNKLKSGKNGKPVSKTLNQRTNEAFNKRYGSK